MLGDTLIHGEQDNATECGILTANTAAHEIFNDELWGAEEKADERACWFNVLRDVHIEEVRI